MPTPSLYKAQRFCCACSADAPKKRSDFSSTGPNILSITPVVYFYGRKGRQLKNAPCVQVCEDCLATAIASPASMGGSLWRALQNSLSACYSAMDEAQGK